MKQNLIDIVRTLKDSLTKQDTVLSNAPGYYGIAIMDNPYVDEFKVQLSALMPALFGEANDDINWFLFEFTAGKSPGPHCIEKNGTAHTYHTNEDYYTYLKNEYP